jgi:hypothetical protein
MRLLDRRLNPNGVLEISGRTRWTVMPNLYQTKPVEELYARLARLRSDSFRQWGKMTPAQAMAHCSAQLEMMLGRSFPPRRFIGRFLGRFAKAEVLGEKPIRRNMPTDANLIITDERDLDGELLRVRRLIAEFVEAGPEGCTRHPHSFFGNMSPTEWATLMYKHLDHHLRQFGV